MSTELEDGTARAFGAEKSADRFRAQMLWAMALDLPRAQKTLLLALIAHSGAPVTTVDLIAKTGMCGATLTAARVGLRDRGLVTYRRTWSTPYFHLIHFPDGVSPR